MDLIIQVVTSATVSAFLTAVLIWLAKAWMSERLKTAIKHEYDQKLEVHKAQLKASADIELEKLRSQLSILNAEHTIKFSKLHEKRADVIVHLYTMLVQTYRDAESFSSIMEWAGEPNKQEKYQTAMKSSAEFYRFFDKNRIYIPESICNQIEGFVREMRVKSIDFGVFVKYDESILPDHKLEKKEKAWEAAWTYFEKEATATRRSLENEFRTLLGSSE